MTWKNGPPSMFAGAEKLRTYQPPSLSPSTSSSVKV